MKLLERVLKKIQEPNNESLKMSINHCHVRGVFSLVVDGSEFGKLTRVFVADEPINPFDVQLHTHRYPISITTIKGDITHHLAVKVGCIIGSCEMDEYKYNSFLNGGNGLKYNETINVSCSDYKIPTGASIELGVDDYHTISCSKYSIWIVEEHGFKTDESRVLGVPFVLDGLYSDPAMFQINDKCQIVAMEIKKILEAYKLI